MSDVIKCGAKTMDGNPVGKEDFLPEDTLFLVVPVCHYIENGKVFYEVQACDGLEMFCRHFSSVTIASPQMSREEAKRDKTVVWAPATTIPSIDKVNFVSLPKDYSFSKAIKNYLDVSAKIRPFVLKAKYLHFAIGGLVGDWGSLAAYEACKLKRPYSVHMDWISHKVYKTSLGNNASMLKRGKRNIHSELMRLYNNYFISKAYAALCNGKTCYNYYKKINRNSFKIHDIHVDNTFVHKDLDGKKEGVKSSTQLKAVYAGRMEQIKSPITWLKAIAHARDLGVDIQGTWFGNGSLFAAFKKEIEALKLQDTVRAPGYLEDKQQLFEKLGQSDIFLMTHVSDESPRCIIEALKMGTPVFGYESEYAEDILGRPQAGMLSKVGDWEQLGKNLAFIDKNRDKLTELIEIASSRGKKFTSETVFKERVGIIKNNLPSVNK